MKPVEIDITLTYSCPDCGYRWWFTLRELRGHNWTFTCHCDRTVRVDPIEDVTFAFKSGDVTSIFRRKPKHKKPKKFSNKDVVKALVGLGFTVGQARDSINEFVQRNQFSGTDEELLRSILTEIQK